MMELSQPGPRRVYCVQDTYPKWSNTTPEEDKVEAIFAEQLAKLGVEYVDYYLLHNVQTVLYDGLDGKGGGVQKSYLFDHLRR